MKRKTLTIAAARLKQDKAWEAVERTRADLRAAIRNGLKCTNCNGSGLCWDPQAVYGFDCPNCEGFGALDPPHPVKEQCTCNDTYEVGSGNRCPIHEK